MLKKYKAKVLGFYIHKPQEEEILEIEIKAYSFTEAVSMVYYDCKRHKFMTTEIKEVSVIE